MTTPLARWAPAALCLVVALAAPGTARALEAPDLQEVSAPVPLPAGRLAPPRAPRPLPEAQPAPGPSTWRRGFSSSTAVGAGYHLLPQEDEASVGVALEGVGAYRFSEAFSLRVRFGLGLSHFERTASAARLGLDVGGWTAGAYADVARWFASGDPAYGLVRLMASLVAFTGLAAGFAVAGGLLALSPFVATSFVETGLTGALHFTGGASEVFAEAGAGTLFYVNRVRHDVGVGWGPLVGVGVRAGPLALGMHVLWSPPGLNQSRTGHVHAGLLTLRLGL